MTRTSSDGTLDECPDHGNQLVERHTPPLFKAHESVHLAAGFVRMDNGGAVTGSRFAMRGHFHLVAVT